MAIPITIYVIVGVVVFFGALFLISLRGRGKPIVCPECGAQFARPSLPEKRSGLGFTFGGLGDYTCPKCKYRGSSSSFRRIEGDKSTSESS